MQCFIKNFFFFFFNIDLLFLNIASSAPKSLMPTYIKFKNKKYRDLWLWQWDSKLTPTREFFKKCKTRKLVSSSISFPRGRDFSIWSHFRTFHCNFLCNYERHLHSFSFRLQRYLSRIAYCKNSMKYSFEKSCRNMYVRWKRSYNHFKFLQTNILA